LAGRFRYRHQVLGEAERQLDRERMLQTGTAQAFEVNESNIDRLRDQLFALEILKLNS